MQTKTMERSEVEVVRPWPKSATAVSVLGHATLLVFLAVEAPRQLAQVTPPPAIQVEMIAPPLIMPAPSEGSPLPASTASQPDTRQAAEAKRPRPSAGGRITATDYFASTVLDDPKNRETKEKIEGLGSDERLIQLCNIEAMEQLRRWKDGFVPNQVVAYATADPKLTQTSLEAPGAAIHAAGKWYRLSFSCGASPDLVRVASFSFKLGRPIPHEEWEQDSLPELVDGDPTD